uniref:J domain-containing protein n=1 Tax=viral metagenome TaxID=1070528 RepID=A0A6C0LRH4_9ZZZZ
MKNLYQVLDLTETANHEEIKKAYRKLSNKWHPDKNSSEEAVGKMQEINEAYNILSDPEKRSKYDMYGEEGLQDDQNPFSGNNIFQNMFNKQHHGISRILETVYIELEQFYSQTKMKTQIEKSISCEDCQSTGFTDKQIHRCKKCGGTGISVIIQHMGNMQIQQQIPCQECRTTGKDLRNKNIICQTCHGKGEKNIKEDIEFDRPHNIIRDNKVHLKGKYIIKDGKKYEITLEIRIKYPENYEMFHNGKLLLKYRISLAESLCGFKKIINHPSGKKIIIESPPGNVITQEDIYLLDRLGLPIESSCGPLYIRFDINYPKSFDIPAHKKLSFEILEKILGGKLTADATKMEISTIDTIDFYNLSLIKKVEGKQDYDSDENIDDSGAPNCSQQ